MALFWASSHASKINSLASMCAIMRSMCDMCVYLVCSVCTGMFQKVSLQSGVSCVTVLVISDALKDASESLRMALLQRDKAHL